MEFLYTFHSHNRWLILAVAALALLKLALTWLRKADYGAADRILTSAYRWLLTIQVVIGLILIFSLGFVMHRIEHGVTMLIALGLVEFSGRWKTYPGPVRARNTAAVIVGSLLLIAIGISRLPQGWTRTIMP